MHEPRYVCVKCVERMRPERSPTQYSECKAAEKSMVPFHIVPDDEKIYLDSSSPSPSIAFRFAACLSCLRSRAALVRARLASISSLICLSRAFSALARWICDIKRVSKPLRSRGQPTADSMARGRTYVLNERPLVFEGVTLGEVVELVVEVLVDLAAGAVLDEQAAEDPLAAHPQNLPASRVSTFLRTVLSFNPSPNCLSLYSGPEAAVVRTRACGRRRYPCAYRSRGGGRCGGRGSARGRASASAW